MLMFEGCGLINVVGSFDVAYNLHVLTTLRSGGAGALLKLCRIFSVYGHHFHVQHQDLKRTATKLMQFLNASDPLHCIDMFLYSVPVVSAPPMHVCVFPTFYLAPVNYPSRKRMQF